MSIRSWVVLGFAAWIAAGLVTLVVLAAIGLAMDRMDREERS